MFLRYVCTVCAVVFLASYISPQLGFYGRGLRVGLPAFTLGAACAFMVDSAAVIRAVFRQKWIFICGSIFMLQAYIRFVTMEGAGYSTKDINAVFVYGIAQVLMGVFLILVVRELGGKYINVLCHGVLLVGAISLCLGIPVLLDSPGVARKVMVMGIMGFSLLEQRSGEGIGTYTQYTGVAVAMLPMLLWLIESKGWWRLLYVGLLAGVAVAVFVSTFTMASAFVALGATAGIAYWVFQRKMQVIPRAIIIGLVGFLSFGTVLAAASGNKGFMFAYDKLGLLWDRVTASGFVQGDKTGRGVMFEQDVDAFMRNPVLGSVGGITEVNMGTGHSSLVNTLAVHGLIGAIFWFLVLFMLMRVTVAHVQRPMLRIAIYGAWVLFFLSGIVNPTWHFSAVTGTLFLFLLTVSDRQSEGAVALSTYDPAYLGRAPEAYYG